MTILSVNFNKLALLRNSRGNGQPNLITFARRSLNLGAGGITVHPRPDQRHIRAQDVIDLKQLLEAFPDKELNVEGYPNLAFIALIEAVQPHQVTLVPDEPGQLTSDHGWNLNQQAHVLEDAVKQLKSKCQRIAAFVDPLCEQLELLPSLGIDRIELYTQAYAEQFGTTQEQSILANYSKTAQRAQELGLGVNAGHDLSLQNLSGFLTIPNILEVSIGHALTLEALDFGWDKTITEYLAICKGA